MVIPAGFSNGCGDGDPVKLFFRQEVHVGIAVVHLTAAITGQVVHDRRRRLADLEERANRAETERELLTRQAVLDERTRIARDLHDVVAHGMSVMVVQAGAAERLVESRPDEAKEALRHVQTTGREAFYLEAERSTATACRGGTLEWRMEQDSGSGFSLERDWTRRPATS